MSSFLRTKNDTNGQKTASVLKKTTTFIEHIVKLRY